MNAVDAMTLRLVADAGIGPGMRVVDIGCGTGAVTLMLAQRVGAGGLVVAVDRDPAMLAAARDRLDAAGVANVAFVAGGFDADLTAFGPLDAALGRRVLMYQPDAAAAVAALAASLRPGAVLAFHEHDTTLVPDERVALPLHDAVRGWLRAMLRAEGANLHMGFDLAPALAAAGLSLGGLRAEANLLAPEADYPVAAIVRAVMPRLRQHGIVTEAGADPDSLDARLAAERRAAGATCLWELVFTAWATRP